jgi:hypothetical protein
MRSILFSEMVRSMSSISDKTREMILASDSHPSRLLQKTRTPYPDLTVSFARATTAFKTGSFNSLCTEGWIVLIGKPIACVDTCVGPGWDRSWLAAFRSELVEEAA